MAPRILIFLVASALYVGHSNVGASDATKKVNRILVGLVPDSLDFLENIQAIEKYYKENNVQLDSENVWATLLSLKDLAVKSKTEQFQCDSQELRAFNNAAKLYAESKSNFFGVKSRNRISTLIKDLQKLYIPICLEKYKQQWVAYEMTDYEELMSRKLKSMAEEVQLCLNDKQYSALVVASGQDAVDLNFLVCAANSELSDWFTRKNLKKWANYIRSKEGTKSIYKEFIEVNWKLARSEGHELSRRYLDDHVSRPCQFLEEFDSKLNNLFSKSNELVQYSNFEDIKLKSTDINSFGEKYKFMRFASLLKVCPVATSKLLESVELLTSLLASLTGAVV